MADEAIPAATLILVRDRTDGPPELLMVERAEGMAFAAGALVFPGGRIDDADRELAADLDDDAGTRSPPSARPSRRRLSRSGSRPARSANCARRCSKSWSPISRSQSCSTRRGLALDAAALTPFARWVPKFHAVRRFDTLFFIARAPAGDWEPRVIEGECAGAHGSPRPRSSNATRAAKRA